MCHGRVDSINGNNATSVRRFIDDAIKLRFSSSSNPPTPFSLFFLSFDDRPFPSSRRTSVSLEPSISLQLSKKGFLLRPKHLKTTYQLLHTPLTTISLLTDSTDWNITVTVKGEEEGLYRVYHCTIILSPLSLFTYYRIPCIQGRFVFNHGRRHNFWSVPLLNENTNRKLTWSKGGRFALC